MSPAESPWTLVFVAAMVAVGLFIAYTRQRRWQVLPGIFACVLAGAAAIAMDEVIETPREQVFQAIQDILDAFQNKQVDRLLGLISDQSPDLQERAAGACEAVTVTNRRLTDVTIELLAQDARATTRFRVNANIQVPSMGINTREPTMWECRWQREGDGWKVFTVQQLDPITEKPAGQPAGLPRIRRNQP